MYRLLLYHLMLAGKGLRRDLGLSAAIAVGMTLATSIFGMALLHTLRVHGPRLPLSAGLSQVELPHPGAYMALTGGSAWTGPLAVRTRVTPRQHALLSAAPPGARQISTFRARLEVAGEKAAPDLSRIAMVRFVTTDFFALFARPFAAGGAWSADDDAAAAPVAVLGRPLARALFGDGDPRGGTLLVDGQPHRIVGALAEHQPLWAEWDLSAFGLDQDAVYLPFSTAATLRARPEMPVFQSPVGPRYEDLLASDAVYISHWIDLPTTELREAYRRQLDRTLGPEGYVLRDLAAWRQIALLPETGAKFFFTLSFILLLGGACNMMRLLLAKGLARREETGIHRALGAPRGAVFTRHMLEAFLLLLPAGVGGSLLALPYIALWNEIVADTDIPMRMTPLGFAITTGTAVATGLLAAIYPAWFQANIKPTLSVVRR